MLKLMDVQIEGVHSPVLVGGPQEAGVALQGVERVDDTGVAHGRIHALGLHSCQLPSRMD